MNNSLGCVDIFGARVFRNTENGSILMIADGNSTVSRWSETLNKWILDLHGNSSDTVRPLFEIKINEPIGKECLIDDLVEDLSNHMNLSKDKFTVDFREEIVINNELFAVIGIRFQDKAVLRDTEFLMYRCENH